MKKRKVEICIVKNTSLPEYLSELCIFLNISRVHVSLFISGSPLPSLCHPFGTVGLHIKNWASTTSRVFASDMRPNNQTHLVYLGNSSSYNCHLLGDIYISIIEFVMVYRVPSGDTPDSFAWNKTPTSI